MFKKSFAEVTGFRDLTGKIFQTSDQRNYDSDK